MGDDARRAACGVGRRVGRGRARYRPGGATLRRPLPAGGRSWDAAVAGAEGTEAGPAVVPRHGGYRDEIGGGAERRREGRGGRCRLRAGGGGAKSRRAGIRRRCGPGRPEEEPDSWVELVTQVAELRAG